MNIPLSFTYFLYSDFFAHNDRLLLSKYPSYSMLYYRGDLFCTNDVVKAFDNFFIVKPKTKIIPLIITKTMFISGDK